MDHTPPRLTVLLHDKIIQSILQTRDLGRRTAPALRLGNVTTRHPVSPGIQGCLGRSNFQVRICRVHRINTSALK